MKVQQKGKTCHDDCKNVSHIATKCAINAGGRIEVLNKFGCLFEKNGILEMWLRQKTPHPYMFNYI